MMVSMQLNQENNMRGAFVISRLWNFVILKKKGVARARWSKMDIHVHFALANVPQIFAQIRPASALSRYARQTLSSMT
jgi:hypothetical protein